eukprot:TRINITY_DN49041_c0_g1_i1.p2 TRINITY_DN49041_c0_g1~~TRINITY_DN49041_c0_g1_i1.p2  ORF type:complete len:259 (+),score=89.07 TRINITY_DN49041_c0_g1_i1:90-866(+)
MALVGGAAAAGLPVNKRASDTSAGGAAKAPKQNKKAEQDSNVHALMNKMMKLTLQNSRKIANLESLNIVTIVFLKDTKLGTQVVERSKAATKMYSDTVKSLSPAEKSAYCSPHIYVWLELLQVTYEHCKQTVDPKQKTLAENILKGLTYFETEFEKQKKEVIAEAMGTDITQEVITRQLTADWIGMCKVSKCFSQSHMKMELAGAADTPGKDVVLTVAKAISQFAAGSKKQGAAPRNDLERQLGAFLDKQQTKNEKPE